MIQSGNRDFTTKNCCYNIENRAILISPWLKLLPVQINIKVPDWARWVAVDKDLTAYSYDRRPILNGPVWMSHGRLEVIDLSLNAPAYFNWRKACYSIIGRVLKGQR